jgi:IS5 family transposase
MGYKQFDESMSFAELAFTSSMEKNRSLDLMNNINAVVNWSQIEEFLLKYYRIGKSKEGADAYSPLLLLKCLLLQKWFRIPSDPELETQINDRISFKKFLGLPFDMPSPDHSTFSRFRKRLSEKAMAGINNEVLLQFSHQGLSINEGIAIDARLVQSASRPLSKEKIKEEREKRTTSEGKVDKNGDPLKFSRDMESDWTVKNDKPHYGLKEHTSVDVNHGFVLATTITPASHHDSPYLPYCTAASCHTKQPINKVYADKGYYGEPNRTFLHLNHIEDGIMRKDTTTAKLTVYEKERNRKISKKRYIVEQYFGLSHLHDGAFRARFTTIVKNILDVMCRQLAFNLFRGSKIIPATT